MALTVEQIHAAADEIAAQGEKPTLSAVRKALEALAAEGYAEAELDQIGDMEGAPDEEPHLSAWQGAIEGEVSIVTFDEPL